MKSFYYGCTTPLNIINLENKVSKNYFETSIYYTYFSKKLVLISHILLHNVLRDVMVW